MDLDFRPSPVEDRPGLLIRDPYQYSDATLIVPPPLVASLECFDGEQTELELRKSLVEITGDLDVSELEQHLISTLSTAGFLLDENFEKLRDGRERQFAETPERVAVPCGIGVSGESQRNFARRFTTTSASERRTPMDCWESPRRM